MLDLDYVPVSREFLEQMGLPVPSSGNAHVVLRERPGQSMEEQAFQSSRQRVMNAIHEIGYNVSFVNVGGSGVGLCRVDVVQRGSGRTRALGSLEEVAGLGGDELATLIKRKFEEAG